MLWNQEAGSDGGGSGSVAVPAEADWTDQGSPIFTPPPIETIDDFEDGDIAEYSGDTGNYTVGSTTVQAGSNSLEASHSTTSNPSIVSQQAADSTDLNAYPTRGSIWRIRVYNENWGNTGAVMHFCPQSETALPDRYGVDIRGRDDLTQEVQIKKSGGGTENVLATGAVSDWDNYNNEWLEVEIDWHDDGTIVARVYDSTGSPITTATADGGSYTELASDTAGIGYRFYPASSTGDTLYFDNIRKVPWNTYLDDCVSPSSILNINGTWHLYYVAAAGNRVQDTGPRRRAIGLMTTTDISDPTSWTQNPNNPIITWLPNDAEEEGNFSTGAFEDSGTVYLYGTACSGTGGSVNCDVRLWTDTSGSAPYDSFTDQGVVLDHSDSSVYGYGDELFAYGALLESGTYYVLYLAKGNNASWDLGLAWGGSATTVSNNSQSWLDDAEELYSGGTFVRRTDSQADVAIPVVHAANGIDDDGSGVDVDVKLADLSDLQTIKSEAETYTFRSADGQTPLLHAAMARDGSTWYLGYMTADESEFRMREATV